MSYPPKIKKSREGLLHDKLGIPRSQKIGEARLEKAAHSRSPSMRQEAQFALNFNHNGHHGEIVGMNPHGRRHVRIEVAHGRRSPRKRDGEGNLPVASSYDDRPTSTVVVPKQHARRFRLGDRVGVGVTHLTDGDAEYPGENDGDEGALEDYRRTVRRITSGPRGR